MQCDKSQRGLAKYFDCNSAMIRLIGAAIAVYGRISWLVGVSYDLYNYA
ncbi:MAG: hypothetical protein J6U29_00495 [Bacteroidales bacterium]|nr:hypothetical protein [Bacteroidales bacterium]